MPSKIKDTTSNIGSKDFFKDFKDEKGFLFNRLKFILDNESELVGELKYIIENKFISNPVFKKDNKTYTYFDIYTPLVWVAFLKLGYYHLFEYLSDNIKNESRFGKAKEFYESISNYISNCHTENHDDYKSFYDNASYRHFIHEEKVVIPESAHNLVLTMVNQVPETDMREKKLTSIKKAYNIEVKSIQTGKKKHKNQKNKNEKRSELDSLEKSLLEMVESGEKKVQLKLFDLDRYVDSILGFGREINIEIEVKVKNLKGEIKNLLNKDQNCKGKTEKQNVDGKTIYLEFNAGQEEIKNIKARIESFKIKTKKDGDKAKEVVDFLIQVKDIKFIRKMEGITKTEKMENKAIKFGDENRDKNIEGEITSFCIIDECDENKEKRKSIKEHIIDFWLKTEQIRDFEDLFSWCDHELCIFICSYICSDIRRYHEVKYKFKERFKIPGWVWPCLWKKKVLKKSLTGTQESIARNNERIVNIVKELNLTKECLIQYIDVDKNDKETKKDLLDYYNSVLNNEDDKEGNRFNLIANLFFVYIFHNIFELPEGIGPFFGTCLRNGFYFLETPRVIIKSFYNAIKLKREDMKKFLLSDIAKKTLSSADLSLSKRIEKDMTMNLEYDIPKKTLFGTNCNLSKRIVDALVYLAQECDSVDSKSFRKKFYDLELNPEQKIGLGFVATEKNNDDKLNVLVDIFKKDFVYGLEDIRFIFGYEEIYIKKLFLACTKTILEDLKSNKSKCLSEKTKSAFDRILEKNEIEYKEIYDLFFDLFESEGKLFVLLLLQNEKFANVLKYIPVKQFLSTLLDFGNDFKFKATLSKLLENLGLDNEYILNWVCSLEDEKKIVALEAIVKNEDKKIAALEATVKNEEKEILEAIVKINTRFSNILKFEKIKQNGSLAEVEDNLFDVIECVLELNYLSDKSSLQCVLKCLEHITDYENKINLLSDIIKNKNVLKIVKQNDGYIDIFRCIENVLNEYDEGFYLLEKVMKNKYICDQKDFYLLMDCMKNIKDYDKKAKMLTCILDQQEEEILKLTSKNENHERIFEYARDVISQSTNFIKLVGALIKHCRNQKEFNFILEIIDNTYCHDNKIDMLDSLFSRGGDNVIKFLEDDNNRKNIFLKVKKVAVGNDSGAYSFLSIFRYVLSYSIRYNKEDGFECLLECLENMHGSDIKILLFKEFIIEPYVKKWASKNDNHSKIFSCFKNLLLEVIDLKGIDYKKLVVFAIEKGCICNNSDFEWLWGYIENMIDCEKKEELLGVFLRGIEFIAQNSSEKQETYKPIIDGIKEIRNDNKGFIDKLDNIFCKYTKFTRAFFKNIKDDYLDKMGDFDEKVELLYYMIKKKNLYMINNQTELVQKVELEYIFKTLRMLFEENKQFEKSDKFINLIKLLVKTKFVSTPDKFRLLFEFIERMPDSNQKLKLLCYIASHRRLESIKKKKASRKAIFEYTANTKDTVDNTWSYAFKRYIADKLKSKNNQLEIEDIEDTANYVRKNIDKVLEKYISNIKSKLELKLDDSLEDDGLEEIDLSKCIKDAFSEKDFNLEECLVNMGRKLNYSLKKQDISECIRQAFNEIGSNVIEKYRAYVRLKSDCILEQKQISDCINDTISETDFNVFKKCIASIKLESNYSPEQIEMIIDNLRSEDNEMRLETRELLDFLFSNELSKNQLDAVVYLINKDSLCEDLKKSLLLDVFIEKRYLCESISAVDEYICNKIFASSPSKSVKDLIYNLLKINDLSGNVKKTLMECLGKKDISFIESKLHSKLENKNLGAQESKKPSCSDKVHKSDAEL